MRIAAVALAIVLGASNVALAQGEPEAPPAQTPVEEEGADAAGTDEAAAPTEPTPAPAPAQTAPPQPAPAQTAPARTAAQPSPPPARETARTSGAPQQPAPSAAVVVRHHRDGDDDDEPEPDPGDPYDILWIELFGGASYVDLRAIQQTNFFPEIVRLAGWGPAGGAAVGFRVEFFSAGIRAALARYDVSDAASPNAVFDVGTAVVEVKLALPIPVVQPFVRVGFGMAWHGDSNVEDTWTSMMVPSDFQTTVFGWVFQGGIGLDVYLVHWFAIGAAFTVELLNMSRQPIESATDVTLRSSGDAIGVQGRGQGAISFHF